MEIRISKRYTKKLLLSIYMFWIFYYPIFWDSPSRLLSQQIVFLLPFAFSVPYVVCNYGHISDMFESKKVIVYSALISLSAFYYFLRSFLASGGTFSFVSSRLAQNLFPLLLMWNLLVIISMMRRWGYTKEDGIKLILTLAMLQGFICLLMLIVPEFKSMANELFLNSATHFNEGDYILKTRVYGICSDYTYGMPIIHGALCGISLYYGLSSQKKYLVHTGLIFFSVFLNGRTGILVAVISIIIAMFFYFRKGKVTLGSLILVILLPTMIYVVVSIIQQRNATAFNFASVLFNELYQFIFKNNAIGTIDYLTNTNFYLPQGFAFLFGEGHRVYGTEAVRWGYIPTDMGFVNDMYMGGLVYISILYVAIIQFVSRVPKSKIGNVIVISIISAWIIANIKGQVTANSIITSVYIYFTLCLCFLPSVNNVK